MKFSCLFDKLKLFNLLTKPTVVAAEKINIINIFRSCLN